MGIRSRLKAWRDSDDYPANRNEWEKAWDYAQMNDDFVRAADPYLDELAEAQALLKDAPDHAISLIVDLARRGSVWSMLNLAGYYLHGEGTPVSFPDAEYWYRLAHEAGSDRGLLGYAWILHHRGAFDQEAEVYAVGVARDWGPALYRAAKHSLENARTLEERLALKPMLQRAADLGHPSAQLMLSRYMMRGRFGLRCVPAGIIRGYFWVKSGLAGLEIGAARLKRRQSEIAPSDVTIH
ncbi:hypothetical protein BH11PSE2_BH11PSE2_13170 [soil metagenome]